MRARVLALEGNLLYVQRGRQLLVLDTMHDGAIVESIALGRGRFWEGCRLGSRLLRLGVHALCPLADGSLVAALKRWICRYDPVSQSWTDVLSIPQGSRPLFLCRERTGGALFFGEYFWNPRRGPVHIYGSSDNGRRFDVAYTFPAGTVRHVHGIFSDPFSDLLWVTVGDTDRESAILSTSDQFRTLDVVFRGTQACRAVQLLFTADSVYFGSDAPAEQNHIQRITRKTGQLERLQAVEGPILYGCKVGEMLFFSTVAQPGMARPTREVVLWESAGGDAWARVATFRKDVWPMRLFQYGQVFFPIGENNTGRVWFTLMATRGDGELCQLETSSLLR